MKVNVEANAFGGTKAVCQVCGTLFGAEDDSLLFTVYDGPDKVGLACPDCGRAGAAAATEALRDRARELRALADTLDRWAARPPEFPSREDVAAAEAEYSVDEIFLPDDDPFGGR